MIPRRATLLAFIALAVGATGATAALIGANATGQPVATGTLAAATAPTTTHPNATGANAAQVNLTWGASASPFVAGHRILRASNPTGPWTTIATLGPTATSASDTGAPYNSDAYYSVQAFRNNWTTDGPVTGSHSLPMTAGIDRVTGAGGTALTGPWSTVGTQLAGVANADATRYQPTSWPIAPTYMAGIHYLDATHAWATGTGSISAFNGTSWTAQNPNTTQSLEQVAFANTTTGWSVGAAGTIVATTNGGTTWTTQTSGTAQGLWDIDCVSATTCWTVGNGGVIRATTNGGTTWVGQTSGTTQALWDVDCVSTTLCWAVGAGGTVRKTTNGGGTWTAQTSGVTSQLLGLSCVSTTQCWISGAGGVVRTTSNAGTTWTAQSTGTTQSVWRVSMLNATVGYLAGNAGEVRKTTDGGATWIALAVPVANYYGLSCVDASRCIAVSDAPAIILTADGGATWGEGDPGYVEFTPRNPTLAAGQAVTAVVARIVFRTTAVPGAGSRFTLLASADAGATWTPFTVTAPTAANTDVTQSIALTSLGFSPTTRVGDLRLRFSVAPKGGAITTQFDLVHVDVN